jgi:hypothetical protein
MQRRDPPPGSTAWDSRPRRFALNTSQIQDMVNLNGQRSRSTISYSAHLKRMWLMITCTAARF